MRERKARFERGPTDYVDAIERPSHNLGVDVYQSYQRKYMSRDLPREDLLRWK